MNLVIISGCDPIDQYVISQIAKSFPIRKLIRPVWTGSSKSSSRLQKLRKLTPTKVLGRLRSIAYRPMIHRNYEAITEHLFGSDGFDLGIPTHDIPRSQINKQSTADLLQELETDILLVSNAPILRERIFTSARMAVNVHYGIAPKYRGTHTVFWPLYLRDYENIGVTLHQIDRGTDTGATLGHGFPALAPGDNEATLSAKNAYVAADLSTRFLHEAMQGATDGELQGEPQTGPGKTYFFRDRKLVCDLKYQLGRRFLGHELPTSAARIETYFETKSPGSLEPELVS